MYSSKARIVANHNSCNVTKIYATLALMFIMLTIILDAQACRLADKTLKQLACCGASDNRLYFTKAT